jgi:hypothetical protein
MYDQLTDGFDEDTLLDCCLFPDNKVNSEESFKAMSYVVKHMSILLSLELLRDCNI